MLDGNEDLQKEYTVLEKINLCPYFFLTLKIYLKYNWLFRNYNVVVWSI